MKKNNSNVESKFIDTAELMAALDEIEKEQGISKEDLIQSIETALLVAYKRNFESNDENIKIEMDKNDGSMHVFQEKTVVEEVENDQTEISIDDAKKISTDYNEGSIVRIELIPKNFGRIAAQTAKQVITQKIREMSRDIIFTEFKDRIGEIVTGLIQKSDGGPIIMDLGKIEGIMPKKDQIPTEKYNVNDKIRAIISSVERGVKGSTQIIVSRANTEFVKKLFEIEIPEIYEGLIEIKSISREAGGRSKIAVYSQNPNIDPVGSCVGQRGVRIQNIINELNGEKIDVIEWNEDPSIFISSALLPARALAVDIKDEEKFAQVIVEDDQLSLAIGKGGQNVKLAARLTGWKIDIKSESQFRKLLEEKVEEENTENKIEDESNISESKVAETENIEEEPKKKTTRKSTAKKNESNISESKVAETENIEEEPKKKTTRKSTAKKNESNISENEVAETENIEEEPKKKTTKKSVTKK